MNFIRFIRVFAALLCVLTAVAAFSQQAIAQKISDIQSYKGDENRPFDPNDKYYEEHGVSPAFIVNRRTGMDKYSVFDFIDSDIYRQVRIIATSPAYGFDGRTLFWVSYGDLFTSSFLPNRKGKEAIETAERVPVYLFPSSTVKRTDRQAVLVDDRRVPAEKNPLGLATAVIVRFTSKIYTKEGIEICTKLAGKNGFSLDGTPILKTVDEIGELARKEMITMRMKGIEDKGDPSYLMFHKLEDPRNGAISADAYLMITTDSNGKPLKGEIAIYENFNCLQLTGKWCNGK